MNEDIDSNNRWQKFVKLNQDVAKESHGVITISNFLTAAGLILSVKGAQKMDTKDGITMFAAGQALDMLDGRTARALGTDKVSDVGKYGDTISDKLKMLIVLLESKKRGIVNPNKAHYIIARNLGSTICAGVALLEGKEFNTRDSGRGAIALESASLIADLSANAMERSGHDKSAKIMKSIGWISIAASVPFGIKSTKEYAQDAGILPQKELE